MKVLFVFNHPAPYKVRLFNEISKFCDLDVIFERKSAKDRPSAFYNCSEFNFNYRVLKRGAFAIENSNTGELTRYIKEHHKEYDLIIMNGYRMFTEMRAIHYMNKNKIPYVLYINGGVTRKETRFKSKIKKYFIGSASKYISPCVEADEYLLAYGAREKDIYHYPYSTFHKEDILKSPLTRKEKYALRNKYQLPEGQLFLAAGQFISRKNNLLLISLFKDLKDKTLVIYGDGPLKRKYLKYIKENKIENVLIRKFLNKKDLFEVMKSADCFVTLSKEDIYGHTTNEAFANGLPVISSDKVISSKHLIKNGVNGYLVSLKDSNSIIEALKSINDSMSQNALDTANENTIEKTTEAHKVIFEELTR